MTPPGRGALRRVPWLACVAALATAAVAACRNDVTEVGGGASTASATAAPPSGSVAALPPSAEDEIAHGKQLVAKFECARCHDGTGEAPVARERGCVGCHRAIRYNEVSAPVDALQAWWPKVKPLSETPTLAAVGSTLDPAFVKRYLREPFDVRPHLVPSMPRLAIDEAEASAIAAYLASLSRPPRGRRVPGDVAKGRALFIAKDCARCHVYSGAMASRVPPTIVDREEIMLAPDLRFARDRLLPDALADWIMNPKAIRPDTHMSSQGVTRAEANDLAAFVLEAPLEPVPERSRAERLPVLTRAVTYDEVEARVLHRTCWHCHAEPDFARGDGGPGRTGGFGFRARDLDLSSYEGVLGGYVDDGGARRSVVSSTDGVLPPLVSALVARQEEERGRPGAHRGMPMGFPAVSAEDVQLVESWIAQGHPR